jgi:hypothetical protein
MYKKIGRFTSTKQQAHSDLPHLLCSTARTLTESSRCLSSRQECHMFTFNVRPEVHLEPSIHLPVKESEAGRDTSSPGTIPASVLANTADPFAARVAGKPTGLVAHLPHAELTAVTLPGDPNQYFIKSASNLSTPQALYTGGMQTGVLKQTSKKVLADGHGGWKLDNGLPGGGLGSLKQGFSKLGTSKSAHNADPRLAQQKQEAIAKANAEYRIAQNELGPAREKLRSAEQELRMIEQTHGQSGDFWSAIRPPSSGRSTQPLPRDYALHQLRRPGLPLEYAELSRRGHSTNPNYQASFKAGKERRQAEDAVARAKLQVAAAQRKVDAANHALRHAMSRP